ncbi:hypothetical protein IWQ62_002997 [Dispira parvispora]|uniref:Nucleolar 27S pre-rRNA processing Urb2/Npa2 C-terminal domain-containing protein n=1 Tax=Dispira parvispora TaxID=1520584 RepID=A0A9W8AV01_9FUNG|nr:hypothetical protein IWQ62_002997 [Dispira parvispora]
MDDDTKKSEVQFAAVQLMQALRKRDPNFPDASKPSTTSAPAEAHDGPSQFSQPLTAPEKIVLARQALTNPAVRMPQKSIVLLEWAFKTMQSQAPNVVSCDNHGIVRATVDPDYWAFITSILYSLIYDQPLTVAAAKDEIIPVLASRFGERDELDQGQPRNGNTPRPAKEYALSVFNWAIQEITSQLKTPDESPTWSGLNDTVRWMQACWTCLMRTDLATNLRAAVRPLQNLVTNCCETVAVIASSTQLAHHVRVCQGLLRFASTVLSLTQEAVKVNPNHRKMFLLVVSKFFHPFTRVLLATRSISHLSEESQSLLKSIQHKIKDTLQKSCFSDAQLHSYGSVLEQANIPYGESLSLENYVNHNESHSQLLFKSFGSRNQPLASYQRGLFEKLQETITSDDPEMVLQGYEVVPILTELFLIQYQRYSNRYLKKRGDAFDAKTSKNSEEWGFLFVALMFTLAYPTFHRWTQSFLPDMANSSGVVKQAQSTVASQQTVLASYQCLCELMQLVTKHHVLAAGWSDSHESQIRFLAPFTQTSLALIPALTNAQQWGPALAIALKTIGGWCQLDETLVGPHLPTVLRCAMVAQGKTQSSAAELFCALIDNYSRSRRLDYFFEQLAQAFLLNTTTITAPLPVIHSALFDSRVLQSLMQALVHQLPFIQSQPIIRTFCHALQTGYFGVKPEDATFFPGKRSSEESIGDSHTKRRKVSELGAVTVNADDGIVGSPASDSDGGILGITTLLSYFIGAVHPTSPQQTQTWNSFLATLYPAVVAPLLSLGDSPLPAALANFATSTKVLAGLSLHIVLLESSLAYREQTLTLEWLESMWNQNHKVFDSDPRCRVTVTNAILQWISYRVSQPQYYMERDTSLRGDAVMKKYLNKCLAWVDWSTLTSSQQLPSATEKNISAAWDRRFYTVTSANEAAAYWYTLVHDYLDVVGRYGPVDEMDHILRGLFTHASSIPENNTSLTGVTDQSGWTCYQTSLRVLRSAWFYEIPSVKSRAILILTGVYFEQLHQFLPTDKGDSDAGKVVQELALVIGDTNMAQKARQTLMSEKLAKLQSLAIATVRHSSNGSTNQQNLDAIQRCNAVLEMLLILPTAFISRSQVSTVMVCCLSYGWFLRQFSALPAGSVDIRTSKAAYLCEEISRHSVYGYQMVTEIINRLLPRFKFAVIFFLLEHSHIHNFFDSILSQAMLHRASVLQTGPNEPLHCLGHQLGDLLQALIGHLPEASETNITVLVGFLKNVLDQLLGRLRVILEPSKEKLTSDQPTTTLGDSFATELLERLLTELVKLSPPVDQTSQRTTITLAPAVANFIKWLPEALGGIREHVQVQVTEHHAYTQAHPQGTFSEETLMALGHTAHLYRVLLLLTPIVSADSKFIPCKTLMPRLFTLSSYAVQGYHQQQRNSGKAALSPSLALLSFVRVTLDTIVPNLESFTSAWGKTVKGNTAKPSVGLVAQLVLAHIVAYLTFMGANPLVNATSIQTAALELIPSLLIAVRLEDQQAMLDMLLSHLAAQPPNTGRTACAKVDSRRLALLHALGAATHQTRGGFNLQALIKSRTSSIMVAMSDTLRTTRFAPTMLQSLVIIRSLTSNQGVVLSPDSAMVLVSTLINLSNYDTLTLESSSGITSQTARMELRDIFHQLYYILYDVFRRHTQSITLLLPTLLTCVGHMFNLFTSPSGLDQLVLDMGAHSTLTSTASEIDGTQSSEPTRFQPNLFPDGQPLFGFFLPFRPLPVDCATLFSRLLMVIASPLENRTSTKSKVSKSAMDPFGATQNSSLLTTGGKSDRLQLRGTLTSQFAGIFRKYVPTLLAHYFQVQVSSSPIADSQCRAALRPGLMALIDLLEERDRNNLLASLNTAGKALLKDMYEEYNTSFRYKGHV